MCLSKLKNLVKGESNFVEIFLKLICIKNGCYKIYLKIYLVRPHHQTWYRHACNIYQLFPTIIMQSSGLAGKLLSNAPAEHHLPIFLVWKGVVITLVTQHPGHSWGTSSSDSA